MDNILVLAYAEEDRDYVADFAETLIDAGKNIVLDQYDLSALRGQKLFHYLDDIVERGSSHEVRLLLPHQYVTSHVNSASPPKELYVFHIYLNDIDAYVSPPWILCIRKPTIRKIRPGPARASSNRPFDQANSPDSFSIPHHPTDANLRRLPEKKDKSPDKPNKQNKTRRFVTVLREFEEVILSDHVNPAAYTGLGNALWCLERYDEAFQAFLKAIQLAPENASAYNGLGSTFWCLEKYDKALQCYEEVTHLSQLE
jgi:tetratricopeptide (TPR) repeat protein